MKVRVYEGEMLVGMAHLDHVDPPMGVTFRPFSPSLHYNLDTHANVVEGKYVGDRGRSLAVSDDQHTSLERASITIEDYGDLGRQLTLFFRDGANFAILFGAHPDYQAYHPHLDKGS